MLTEREAELTRKTLEEIRKYYERKDFGAYVVDPHTAVGLAAQERSKVKA